jgi:hypothetical protein
LKVQVDVPDALFWRLAGAAEDAGLRVDQWLVKVASSFEAPDDEAAGVAVRWRRGLCDADVARELGWTNLRAATVRRELGLPANKRRRVR